MIMLYLDSFEEIVEIECAIHTYIDEIGIDVV